MKRRGNGNWWSQRDLNPCLHLERVPSWTKLDDGTAGHGVRQSLLNNQRESTIPLAGSAIKSAASDEAEGTRSRGAPTVVRQSLMV